MSDDTTPEAHHQRNTAAPLEYETPEKYAVKSLSPPLTAPQLARRSLLFSLAFFFTPIPSLFATGYALRAAFRLGSLERRLFLQIALALLLGFAGVGVWVFSLAALANKGVRPAPVGILCANHLRQIGLACINYAQTNRGTYPNDLETLVHQRYLSRPDVLVCPELRETLTFSSPPTGPEITAAQNSSYVYLAKGLTDKVRRPEMIAFGIHQHSGRGHVVMVYNDATVKTLDAAPGIAMLNKELSSRIHPGPPTTRP